MDDMVIDEQIHGDRHAAASVRLESRRTSGWIPAVIEPAVVSDLHRQELFAPRRAPVVGEFALEASPFGVGPDGATGCEGLRMLERALTCGDGLLGSDAKGDVTVHGNLPAPGLVDDREVGVPRDVLV